MSDDGKVSTIGSTAPTLPTFSFEVVAKVETLKLDDSMSYVLQGRLGLLGQDGEPQMFAFALPYDDWRRVECGDLLTFPMLA